MHLRFVRPRLDDLHSAPELATLSLLEAAADVAIMALLAVHPDDDALDGDPPAERRAACDLLDAARHVTASVNRYRLALVLARNRDRDELLPF